MPERTFASEYDARCFASGVAMVFTRDPKGELRVDPERTREMWAIVGDATADGGGVYVLTDRVTGVRMVMVTNHGPLAEAQPRADHRRTTWDDAVREVDGQFTAARPEPPPGE